MHELIYWGMQVDILKANLAKADEEIAELDRLLEHTRKVSCTQYPLRMHSDLIIRFL